MEPILGLKVMFGGSKAKAAVLAAGVAGITISGTVYGAGLKTDQQKKEVSLPKTAILREMEADHFCRG